LGVECSFLLQNVTEQREKFCPVVQSLSRNSMRLVESPLAELMYNPLKDRLLAFHLLTDIQKVELLVDMPNLGDRKPSQLQAAMIEACPRGQEDSVFMSAPVVVKILLAHMDLTRLKELTTASDQLVAMRTGPVAVSALVADPGEVAEVAAQGRHADAWRRWVTTAYTHPTETCLRNSSGCSTPPGICHPLLHTVCYTSWRRQGHPSPPNFGG
jgi:hypothetical protein